MLYLQSPVQLFCSDSEAMKGKKSARECRKRGGEGLGSQAHIRKTISHSGIIRRQLSGEQCVVGYYASVIPATARHKLILIS